MGRQEKDAEIVTALAALPAPVHRIADHTILCVLCWAVYPTTLRQHKPECPWRRSREART